MDSSLFEKPYFALLESSLGGRYTIAAWDPVEVIEAKEGENFFETLRSKLKKAPVGDPEAPFTGGWVGYLGYELYSDLENKVPPRPSVLLPKAVFCRYETFEVMDHGSRNQIPPTPLFQRGDFSPQSNFSKTDYLAAVQKIKSYITAGDCYQVNLSQRFTAPVSETPYEIYQRLRSTSPAPYSAFLNLGGAQILSSSPECFLEVTGQHVITRPIKGTRKRGASEAEDKELRENLANSKKDRAELLMITDLERNDLGRVCEPGSIRVPELQKIESFPQVHHLVATIEGTLQKEKSIVDLLEAVFPGGSITGAPKIRAMQIIRDLEPHARDVYCGAIGYISDNGKAQFNIAIRTMVLKNNQAYFWGGGGIVADSEAEKEYEETLVKSEGIKNVLLRA